MDSFDDIFAPVTTNVRAGGKFQPKFRQQPKKRGLASSPKLDSSGPPSAEVSGARDDLSSIDVKTEGLKETRDENSGNRLSQSEVGFVKVDKDELIDSRKEIVSSNVPRSGVDTEALARVSNVGKSCIENVDIFSELEFLDDFIPQTTNETGNDESLSQSKIDTDSKHAEKFLTSYGVDPEVPNSMLPAGDLTVEAHCTIDSSEFTMCEVVPPQTGPECENATVENEGTEIMAAGTFFDFDTSEATVVSGQHSGKFKPRPNLRKGKDKVSTHDHLAEVGYSLPSEEAADLVSSNNDCIRDVTISDYSLEDSIDCSPTRLVNTSSSMPEIQMSEEPTSFMEAICSDAAVNADGQTESLENSTERNHQKKFKSSKQLHNRLKQILEEPDESTDDPPYEPPTTSYRDEDENNDDTCVADQTSRKRKATRKAKEPPLPGNEKPVAKGKRGKKVSEELTNKPPRKKFSHSSRRNKRTVDKALLDTPEDEIDTQRVPIRDLILLAEHRERMIIKDAAKPKTPQTNQSVDDSLREDAYREEDLLQAEHGLYSDEDQPQERVQPTEVYVNYQTYMDKKPGARWSKMETELFYEAVRQFGTDFTMIQKLFPNRTRGQVKSKFKREERQNPLLLSDAAMNRAKDHTHFEFVIEQLQKDAAAKQEACGVYSAAMSGEEDVEDDANEVGTKPEENDETTGEQESEVVDAQSSQLKSDKSEEEDEDDDFDRWNQYDY